MASTAAVSAPAAMRTSTGTSVPPMTAEATRRLRSPPGPATAMARNRAVMGAPAAATTKVPLTTSVQPATAATIAAAVTTAAMTNLLYGLIPNPPRSLRAG